MAIDRAERRRQKKEQERFVTRPDSAKGARKRRAVEAAMTEAAQEAAVRMRARKLLKD